MRDVSPTAEAQSTRRDPVMRDVSPTAEAQSTRRDPVTVPDSGSAAVSVGQSTLATG